MLIFLKDFSSFKVVFNIFLLSKPTKEIKNWFDIADHKTTFNARV